MKFNMTIEFDEIMFEAEGQFTPSTPDIMYFSNGDPGEPGSAAEIIIETVTAYIPRSEDDDEQVAVAGGAVLDFGDKWAEFEASLIQLVDDDYHEGDDVFGD